MKYGNFGSMIQESRRELACIIRVFHSGRRNGFDFVYKIVNSVYMRNAAKKTKKTMSVSTEIVSARLAKPEIAILRKIYPGRSNQAIIETLVEEKLARKYFDSWLAELKSANQSGDLDLEKV